MAAVTIQNLWKTYPAENGMEPVTAVKELSLDIGEGEFFGLLGPNGAGKTTVINLLTGLADRDQGHVSVFGSDVEDDRVETKQRIGVAPQEFNFDRFLDVKPMLVYHGGYYGLTKRESTERAEELLNRFDLVDKAEANIRSLSGGQKRRLLLARALMHDPDIVILDEPTAGIDVQIRHDLWEYMQDLNDAGKTVILTTHYIEEAEMLCERVGIMDNGQLVTTGEPQKLRKQRGMEEVSISIEDVPDNVVEELEQRGLSAEYGQNTLTIQAENWDSIAPVLVKLLSGESVVHDLQVKRQSLEDVFIELTGGESS